MDIYEAADAFKEIGAGVMLWGRIWKIFLELGLKEDIARIAFIPDDDRKRKYTVYPGTSYILLKPPQGWSMIFVKQI